MALLPNSHSNSSPHKQLRSQSQSPRKGIVGSLSRSTAKASHTTSSNSRRTRLDWKQALFLVALVTVLLLLEWQNEDDTASILRDARLAQQQNNNLNTNLNSNNNLNLDLLTQTQIDLQLPQVPTTSTSKKTKRKGQKQWFDWNWIDPNIPGMCGFSKCFFRAKIRNETTIVQQFLNNTSSQKRQTRQSQERHDQTSTSLQFDTGYILAFDPNCNLTLGYSTAQYLHSQYGLQHLYENHPLRIRVTQRLVNYTHTKLLPKIKSKFYQPTRIGEFIKRLEGVPPIFRQNRVDRTISFPTMQVQRVKIPRTPLLEWGDNGKRNQKCRTMLSDFLPGVVDKLSFFHHLQTQAKHLKSVFQKEPWLVWDFQILVDTNGTIHHIDLDRRPTGDMTKPKARRQYIPSALKVLAWKVLATATDDDLQVSERIRRAKQKEELDVLLDLGNSELGFGLGPPSKSIQGGSPTTIHRDPPKEDELSELSRVLIQRARNISTDVLGRIC